MNMQSRLTGKLAPLTPGPPCGQDVTGDFVQVYSCKRGLALVVLDMGSVPAVESDIKMHGPSKVLYGQPFKNNLFDNAFYMKQITDGGEGNTWNMPATRTLWKHAAEAIFADLSNRLGERQSKDGRTGRKSQLTSRAGQLSVKIFPLAKGPGSSSLAVQTNTRKASMPLALLLTPPFFCRDYEQDHYAADQTGECFANKLLDTYEWKNGWRALLSSQSHLSAETASNSLSGSDPPRTKSTIPPSCARITPPTARRSYGQPGWQSGGIILGSAM